METEEQQQFGEILKQLTSSDYYFAVFNFGGGSSKLEKPAIETFKNAPPEMIPQNNNL